LKLEIKYMQGKVSPMKLLDKAIWNPRPVMAVSGHAGSFLLFLGQGPAVLGIRSWMAVQARHGMPAL
jgi:hypothetical protein